MTLSSKNQNDLPKLLKWGKAKGAVMLNNHFKNCTPFSEIILTDNIDELKEIVKSLPKDYYFRRDMPIGEKFSSRIPKDDSNNDIVGFFETMKSSNPKSAILILPSKIINAPRYKCPGAVSGKIALTGEKAIELKQNNTPAILVRNETSSEDLEGMIASIGMLTALGGLTSHASVVARSLQKPCIVGCSSLKIDYKNKNVTIDNIVLNEGDYISIDGENGNVYLGSLKTTNNTLPENLTLLLSTII